MKKKYSIRDATPGDLESIIDLDEVGSAEAKPEYWQGIFSRFVETEREDRLFLVAEINNRVIGFIAGEIRAWEFGSSPCGWVFALTVSQDVREMNIGRSLFYELTARMKRLDISIVRTMADIDNRLTLSFFRSMGLRTGKYIELEKKLDEPEGLTRINFQDSEVL